MIPSKSKTRDIDNRDSGQMYEYLEARIEVLKRRIADLEDENARLTFELLAAEYAEGKQFHASA